MRYLGGKFRIRKYLANVIGRGNHLIEPFMGGGSMTSIFAQRFKQVEAYDNHVDLILMWQALQQGWSPPLVISEDEYSQLKFAEPSALRGFAGFACSWGGKWFGGYARGNLNSGLKRDYVDGAIGSFKRDMGFIKKVKITCLDYRLLKPATGAVIYADPPYRETTSGKEFNHKEFWDIANQWTANGCKVYVSELEAPKDWQVVWRKERIMFLRSKLETNDLMMEKLYYKCSDGE